MQKPLNGLVGITKIIVIIRRNQKGLLPRRKRGKGAQKMLACGGGIICMFLTEYV
jgi:hypothetical protein